MAREAVRDAVHGSESGSVEKLLEELIQRKNEWHTCPEAERCARGIPPSTEYMNLLEGGGVSGVSGVSVVVVVVGRRGDTLVCK